MRRGGPGEGVAARHGIIDADHSGGEACRSHEQRS